MVYLYTNITNISDYHIVKHKSRPNIYIYPTDMFSITISIYISAI